jgi:hypothetical protein
MLKTYCSVTCSNIVKANNPEVRQKRRETIEQNGGWSKHMKKIHMKNPHISQLSSTRMKTNNPMFNPENVEKMRQKLIGRTFLSRGGNGKITPQQELLWSLLGEGWEMELPILTKNVKTLFKSLPASYKVDIGNQEMKISIEVDGNSHKSKKWKFLDKRKTNVLNSLGWKVLRFWNEEVMTNPQMCVQKIRESMI